MCLSLLNHAQRPETQFQWHSCNLYVTESLLKGTFHTTFLLSIYPPQRCLPTPAKTIYQSNRFHLTVNSPFKIQTYSIDLNPCVPAWPSGQSYRRSWLKSPPMKWDNPPRPLHIISCHRRCSFKQTWPCNMQSNKGMQHWNTSRHAQNSNNIVTLLASWLISYWDISKLLVIVYACYKEKDHIKSHAASTLRPTPPSQQESGHAHPLNTSEQNGRGGG